ncbi:helix-turn-helix domain-containing protein [Frisingicoccus sp.]|uniref:helix-turn-helix domain-containing protein n=1 Tax=Frisingicoccus sp. TaxID=1918627 RepID=UPI002EA8C8F6|nr:helix-turn-helix domain-containing protein [Frisingicoccus sp.]
MDKKKSSKYLPVSVIEGAIQGEPEAIRAVWRRYDYYINTLCSRPYQDYYGNIRFMIDLSMKDFLKAQLAWAIMNNFKIEYEKK